MDQQLVIKLTSGDGTGVPVGLVESPPMLYTNLKALYPTVTFSDIATPSETEPYWYGVYEWNSTPADVPYNKNVKELGLKKNDKGIWRLEFELIDASTEEISARTDEKASFERAKRNRKLKLSDWVELPIAELTVEMKAKYDTYRQQLRDYPSQAGFPWTANFPTPPKDE
jgi:hypothetical protein